MSKDKAKTAATAVKEINDLAAAAKKEIEKGKELAKAEVKKLLGG